MVNLYYCLLLKTWLMLFLEIKKLSNCTQFLRLIRLLSRRIDERHPMRKNKYFKNFSNQQYSFSNCIHLDENTDITNMDQFRTLLRYKFEGSVKEEFFCSLKWSNYRESTFEIYISYRWSCITNRLEKMYCLWYEICSQQSHSVWGFSLETN